VHYTIKILVISRFNYYEIMLINYLLIVYDAYRVNKLIEAKLGLSDALLSPWLGLSWD